MERLLTLPIKEDEWESIQKKVPEGDTPLWEYWREFAEDFLARGGSAKTIESIRSFISYLLRYTDAVSIEYCNSARNLSETLKTIKTSRKFKGVTHNKYKGCINTYFRWLEDMEYIKENRVKKVRKFKEDSVAIYALTSEQIDDIFTYIYEGTQKPLVKSRNMLFFNLLRTTAARRCELLALTTEDIYRLPIRHGKGGNWIVRLHRAKQKGSVDYLSVPDWVGDSYHAYMEIRNKTRPNEKNLFVSQSKFDTGLTEKGVIYFMEQMERDLGYKITSKAFRTHVATRLMEEDMSIQDVSFYLGHKRLSTTMRYVKRTHLLHRKCSTVMENQINEKNLTVKSHIRKKII